MSLIIYKGMSGWLQHRKIELVNQIQIWAKVVYIDFEQIPLRGWGLKMHESILFSFQLFDDFT